MAINDVSDISFNNLAQNAKSYRSKIQDKNKYKQSFTSSKMERSIGDLIISSNKAVLLATKLANENNKKFSAQFTNIPDRLKQIKKEKAKARQQTSANNKTPTMAVLSIDKNVKKIYDLLNHKYGHKAKSKNTLDANEAYDAKKMGLDTKKGKKWKANIFSFLATAARQSSLKSLGVDQNTYFQSRFGEGEQKKGLISSAIRAYKVASDETTMSIQEKMLKALLDMNKALAGEDSVIRLVADRLLMEHAIFRETVATIKGIYSGITSPYRLYKWATKSRGGYQSKLPRGQGSAEHTAAVLDMIYVDSMWRLDNIVHHLKQQYNLWNDYMIRQDGVSAGDPTDASKRTYSLMPKLSELYSKMKDKWKSGREMPEYQRYVTTSKDLLEKQVNIGTTQVNIGLQQISLLKMGNTLMLDLLACQNCHGEGQSKNIQEIMKKMSIKPIGRTEADRRLDEDDYINDKDHPERMIQWQADTKFKNQKDNKFQNVNSKIASAKKKINDRKARKIYKKQWNDYLTRDKDNYASESSSLSKEALKRTAVANHPIMHKGYTLAKRANQALLNEDINIKRGIGNTISSKMTALKSKTLDKAASKIYDKVSPDKLRVQKAVYNRAVDQDNLTDRIVLKLDRLISQNSIGNKLRRNSYRLSFKSFIGDEKARFKENHKDRWWYKLSGFLFGFLKNSISKLLLILTAGLGVKGLLGKGLMAAGTRAIANPMLAGQIAGVGMMAYGGYRGVKKSKEWGVGKVAGGIGGALGGANEGGVGSALAGAAKGAMIGSMFPVIGTAIGAIAGGLLGLFGGKNIAKALNPIMTGVGKLYEIIKSIVLWPMTMLKWVTKKISGAFTGIWDKLSGMVKNAGSVMYSFLYDHTPSFFRKFLPKPKNHKKDLKEIDLSSTKVSMAGIGGVKEKANSFKEEAKKAMLNPSTYVKDKYKDAKKYAKGKWSRYKEEKKYDRIQDLWHGKKTTTQQISSAYGKTKDFIGDKYHQVKNWLGHTSFGKGISEKANGFYKSDFIQNLLTSGKYKWSEFKNSELYEQGRQYGITSEKQFNKVISIVSKSGLMAKAKGMINDPSKVSQSFSDNISKLVNGTKKKMESMGEDYPGFWSKIKTTTNQGKESVEDIISTFRKSDFGKKLGVLEATGINKWSEFKKSSLYEQGRQYGITSKEEFDKAIALIKNKYSTNDSTVSSLNNARGMNPSGDIFGQAVHLFGQAVTLFSKATIVKLRHGGGIDSKKSTTSVSVTIFDKAVNKFSAAVVLFSKSSLIGFIAGAFKKVKNFLFAPFKNLKEKAMSLYNRIKGKLYSTFSSKLEKKHRQEEAKDGIIARIKKKIADAYQRLKDSIHDTIENIKKKIAAPFIKIAEMYNNMKKSISDTIGRAKQKIIDIYENVKNAIGNTIDNVKKAIMTPFIKIADMYHNIKKSVSEMIDGIKKKIMAPFVAIANIYQNIKKSIMDTVTAIWDKIVGVYTSVKNFVTGLFSWGDKDKAKEKGQNFGIMNIQKLNILTMNVAKLNVAKLHSTGSASAHTNTATNAISTHRSRKRNLNDIDKLERDTRKFENINESRGKPNESRLARHFREMKEREISRVLKQNRSIRTQTGNKTGNYNVSMVGDKVVKDNTMRNYHEIDTKEKLKKTIEKIKKTEKDGYVRSELIADAKREYAENISEKKYRKKHGISDNASYSHERHGSWDKNGKWNDGDILTSVNGKKSSVNAKSNKPIMSASELAENHVNQEQAKISASDNSLNNALTKHSKSISDNNSKTLNSLQHSNATMINNITDNSESNASSSSTGGGGGGSQKAQQTDSYADNVMAAQFDMIISF